MKMNSILNCLKNGNYNKFNFMNLLNKTVLVTGANRGIGRALVEEALKRGAARVFAGTRSPFTHPDPRVVPLLLDVTNPSQIRQAVLDAGSLDVLINNAGIALYDDLSDRTMLSQHFAVNFFGIYDLSQAFLPLLTDARGAIVNILSIVALAPLPLIASYSVSKAAAFSLTQSMRAYLVGRGVRVHAVMTGPVDTDMNRGLDIPKASPESAAQAIFDGVERGDEEIFPDPMSAAMAESWRGGAVKAMERQNAGFLMV
jgi:NAD(P)-dependent dehydrogenase (short-subunit alcohol dehydrogenase family)